MESEDSRPGSSASNTSSNSSHNSEQSHPFNNSDDKQRSPGIQEGAPISPVSSSRSRQSCRSASLNEGSQRSQSKSDSETSSSSSTDNEDEDANFETAQAAQSANIEPETVGNEKRVFSESPRRSTRDSSTSSNTSRNNSVDRNHRTSEMNLSHEDLSDVSDLESEKRTSIFNNSKQSIDDDSANGVEDVLSKDNLNNEESKSNSPITDLRQKLEKKKTLLNDVENNLSANEIEDKSLNGKGLVGESLEDLVKSHDDDALDFEAEEGECNDVSKDDETQDDKAVENVSESLKSPKKRGEVADEELEEGEVSDEDEKRPEETEPKPVCRFYTRGQCTWGMSCRFLHPGVTDKGNYTMFDLVRPVPLLQGGTLPGSRSSGYNMHAADYHDYRTERPSLHHRTAITHAATTFAPNHETRPVASDGPVVVESAWERGLRTAKEMMRKANKRKEQDMDFEDKKMHLTLSPDELEKDPYYAKDRLSPAEGIRHPIYPDAIGDSYAATERYARGPPLTHYDEVDPYGRSARYRELPPHRMPQYEDERRLRPAREVIVQRVEPVGRGDEWNDPWMRSKSPGGRGSSRDRNDKRRRDRRSYSSNSSYSSSSSSQSDSSSDSSRSLSSRGHHRRRYATNSHKSPPPASRRPVGRSLRSPSPPPRRSRRTPPTIDQLNNDLTELKTTFILDRDQCFLKGLHHSPSSKRRANTSISPVYNRGSAYSPVHKKKRISPNVKKAHASRGKIRRRHSSSSSDSDSSASDTESDTGSSSSGSTSRSRENTPPKRSRVVDKSIAIERKGVKKVDPPKKRSPITIELKKPTAVGVSALASPTHSSTSERDSKKSRREELLKQLRAVEDAIAKKRSKLS
ncbi:uncharacterized protein LOC142232406 isoform X2 [Haematobia irritans]|uniref:uncharacterized protein LOC142232406 isoform X2 n=1 Tax=Haematobia irritans TaxID=7368 RepID=UPI003F5071C8